MPRANVSRASACRRSDTGFPKMAFLWKCYPGFPKYGTSECLGSTVSCLDVDNISALVFSLRFGVTYHSGEIHVASSRRLGIDCI